MRHPPEPDHDRASRDNQGQYRVNSAIRKTEEWYTGDGWYADGPDFAFDYYSSYVFHPMYLETLQNMKDAKAYTRIHYPRYYEQALRRTQKYAVVLVRAVGIHGMSVTFKSHLPEFRTHLTLFRTVVGQRQPWSYACHQTTECLHIRHFLVAAVPVGAYLYKHILLQVAVSHIAEHGISDFVCKV